MDGGGADRGDGFGLEGDLLLEGAAEGDDSEASSVLLGPSGGGVGHFVQELGWVGVEVGVESGGLFVLGPIGEFTPGETKKLPLG